MRAVWATVLSVWAVIALTAVLAWTRHPAAAPAPQIATSAVQTGGAPSGAPAPPGKLVRLTVAAAPAHATTRTS
jgi:hypothetical protein